MNTPCYPLFQSVSTACCQLRCASSFPPSRRSSEDSYRKIKDIPKEIIAVFTETKKYSSERSLPFFVQSVSIARYPQLLGSNCPPSRRSFTTFGVKVRV